MTTLTYTVFLVPSTSHALKAEQLLKNAGCECKLVPVPRHLSSDCGVSVRVEIEERDFARIALEQGGIDASEWYDVP